MSKKNQSVQPANFGVSARITLELYKEIRAESFEAALEYAKKLKPEYLLDNADDTWESDIQLRYVSRID